MKNIFKYTLLITFSAIMFSCEEDVVLDLRDIEKRLVVEATLTNLGPAAKVSLSYSQAFYDMPELKRFTNAMVAITDQDGNTETLAPDNEGYFVSKDLLPQAGQDYTLSVEIDGQQVEVTSQMPRKVEIGSVVFVPNPFWRNPDSLNVFVNVEDPKGEDNYFRLMINKYGAVPTTELYVVDDTFGKDGTITMPIYFKTFTPGDTIVVELRHINRNLYEYYNGLSENVSGSFNSIAPGNPVSNMPDEVYGYFATYAVDRDTLIVNNMGSF
jgi:hypothetical protein